MADLNRPTEPSSFLEEPRKMPDMINVLTILTFIGSGLGIISAFWQFAKAKSSYDTLSSTNLDQLPGFVKRLSGGDPLEIARKSYENRLPILLLGLIALVLCIYGAVQMRQLKKSGFTFYTVGEVLPIVSGIVFLGGAGAAGLGAMFGYCFIVLFIVLYATQLKYLR